MHKKQKSFFFIPEAFDFIYLPVVRQRKKCQKSKKAKQKVKNKSKHTQMSKSQKGKTCQTKVFEKGKQKVQQAF